MGWSSKPWRQPQIQYQDFICMSFILWLALTWRNGNFTFRLNDRVASLIIKKRLNIPQIPLHKTANDKEGPEKENQTTERAVWVNRAFNVNILDLFSISQVKQDVLLSPSPHCAGGIWTQRFTLKTRQIFSVHKKTKSRRFQISPVWKAFSKKLRFSDGLRWTAGLTVEVKLRFFGA